MFDNKIDGGVVTMDSMAEVLDDTSTDRSEKQRLILRAIKRASTDGEPVPTSAITDATDYPNNIVGYHTRQLIADGLLEWGPDSPGGDASQENRYRLTEDGAALAEEIRTPGETIDALREDMAMVLDELEAAREENQELRENLRELTERHNDFVRTVRERLGE